MISHMVSYQWDNKKNAFLKRARGITFEQVIMHIEGGDLLDIREHPNRNKHSNQQILVIDINHYVYVVPFVEQGGERFLRTIVPSRKLTKQYSR